jgi:hypothetical protein
MYTWHTCHVYSQWKPTHTGAATADSDVDARLEEDKVIEPAEDNVVGRGNRGFENTVEERGIHQCTATTMPEAELPETDFQANDETDLHWTTWPRSFGTVSPQTSLNIDGLPDSEYHTLNPVQKWRLRLAAPSRNAINVKLRLFAVSI